MKTRIEVFIDANLFTWMPNIIIGTTPRRFDRTDERAAFEALLAMRANRIISISAWDKAIDKFLANQGEEVKTAMLDYFNSRISNNTTIVISGEQLALMIDRAQDILFATGEKQDDIAVFTMSYIVRTAITHVATCDGGLHTKWRQYLDRLNSDAELRDYLEFRRRRKPYFVGYPTGVLADIMAN